MNTLLCFTAAFLLGVFVCWCVMDMRDDIRYWREHPDVADSRVLPVEPR